VYPKKIGSAMLGIKNRKGSESARQKVMLWNIPLCFEMLKSGAGSILFVFLVMNDVAESMSGKIVAAKNKTVKRSLSWIKGRIISATSNAKTKWVRCIIFH